VSGTQPSPTLLALDTATEACSVALLRGGRVQELVEAVGQRHSERLLPMVQQLLAQAGIGLLGLDAIAFGAGPGSFTGLRIACGAGQGLAFGLGLPLLPVGNLSALAADVFTLAPQARCIGVAIDARMNEVYWAVYRHETAADVLQDAALQEVVGPSLSSAAACAQAFAELGVDAIGGNALALPSVSWSVDAGQWPQARASAAGIVRLAALSWVVGGAIAPADAAPLYVRDRVALTVDERRAVAGAA